MNATIMMYVLVLIFLIEAWTPEGVLWYHNVISRQYTL